MREGIDLRRNVGVGEKRDCEKGMNEFVFGRKVVYERGFGFMEGKREMGE